MFETTAAVDATDKLDEYETIDTLEEYVLIDSHKVSVRAYRRSKNKLETGPATISGEIALLSLGLKLPSPRSTKMSPVHDEDA